MSFKWGTNEKMKKKSFRGGGTCSLGFRDGPIFYVWLGWEGGWVRKFSEKKNCAQKYSKKKRCASSGKKIEQVLSAIVNFDIG